MLIKILRQEKTILAINNYIEHSIGQNFITAPLPTMQEIYRDLDKRTPLIFVLSPGVDPLTSILKYAKERGLDSDKIFTISLGQGQGPFAERAIETCRMNGGWVILQNCHLGKSFMGTLQAKVEAFNQQ